MFYFIFYGVRYDKGISEILDNTFTSDLYQNDGGKFIKRLILDVGFHLVVKGVWFTMFSAVFILAYFDLRKSRETLEFDSEYRCYVCHLDRDVFHKYKLNFEKHTKNEHKLLNYLYYIMYALTKNPQSISKVEKYVLDKFRIADFSWIPSKDTQSLQQQIKKIKDKKMIITTEY